MDQPQIFLVAIAAFLKYSFCSMMSKHPTHPGTIWTDWMVGLSCFAYLLPSFTIWFIAFNLRGCMLGELAFYIVVAINSFIADYIFMGQISVWHAIDRWTATLCLVLNVIKGLLINKTIFDFITLTLFGGFVSLFLLNGSRNAKTKSVFKMYHIGWHIAGLALCHTLCIWNINRLVNPCLPTMI
eukprot:642055_1